MKFAKKKRLETSLLPNLAQRNYKLSNVIDITNTTNTKDESKTRFWNKSINKMNSDIEKKGSGNYENNLKSNI